MMCWQSAIGLRTLNGLQQHVPPRLRFRIPSPVSSKAKASLTSLTRPGNTAFATNTAHINPLYDTHLRRWRQHVKVAHLSRLLTAFLLCKAGAACFGLSIGNCACLGGRGSIKSKTPRSVQLLLRLSGEGGARERGREGARPNMSRRTVFALLPVLGNATRRRRHRRALGHLKRTAGCDIILVNADGRVVESGNHAQLMQQKGVYPGCVGQCSFNNFSQALSGSSFVLGSGMFWSKCRGRS